MSLPPEMLAPEMLATFSALLLAHVLADFVLQFDFIAKNKANPKPFLLHIFIVVGATYVCLGGSFWLAVFVGLAHAFTDVAKLLIQRRKDTKHNPQLFLADQIAHITILLLASFLVPTAVSSGWWQPFEPMLVQLFALIAGLLLTVVGGGYFVSELIGDYAKEFKQEGLPKAGTVIGQLERSLVFLMIALGQPQGIAFLIAAKSLLRFQDAKKEKVSEYVLIGTLASFAWALAVSASTFWLIRQLK